MNITLAENAGYCFGVKNAVNAAVENAEKYLREKHNIFVEGVFGDNIFNKDFLICSLLLDIKS